LLSETTVWQIVNLSLYHTLNCLFLECVLLEIYWNNWRIFGKMLLNYCGRNEAFCEIYWENWNRANTFVHFLFKYRRNWFQNACIFFSFFRKELDAATSKTPEGPDVPIIGATSMPHPIWYLFWFFLIFFNLVKIVIFFYKTLYGIIIQPDQNRRYWIA
jgi:hypothetical protein